jgi:hypothetical protein
MVRVVVTIGAGAQIESEDRMNPARSGQAG